MAIYISGFTEMKTKKQNYLAELLVSHLPKSICYRMANQGREQMAAFSYNMP